VCGITVHFGIPITHAEVQIADLRFDSASELMLHRKISDSQNCDQSTPFPALSIEQRGNTYQTNGRGISPTGEAIA
jgi:hypothetical protein